MSENSYTVWFGSNVEFMALEFGHVEHGDPEPYRWVAVEVSFQFGAFKGHYPASLLTSEVRTLLSDLRELNSAMEGKVEFSALETQVAFRLTMHATGKLSFAGELTDAPGRGNRLRFESQIDQTYLEPVIATLGRVVRDRF